MEFSRLLPYRRQLRPAIPESLPTYLDGEFRRIDNSSRDVVQALQDLDERLKRLGA